MIGCVILVDSPPLLGDKLGTQEGSAGKRVLGQLQCPEHRDSWSIFLKPSPRPKHSPFYLLHLVQKAVERDVCQACGPQSHKSGICAKAVVRSLTRAGFVPRLWSAVSQELAEPLWQLHLVV